MVGVEPRLYVTVVIDQSLTALVSPLFKLWLSAGSRVVILTAPQAVLLGAGAGGFVLSGVLSLLRLW